MIIKFALTQYSTGETLIDEVKPFKNTFMNTHMNANVYIYIYM